MFKIDAIEMHQFWWDELKKLNKFRGTHRDFDIDFVSNIKHKFCKWDGFMMWLSLLG